MSNSGNDYVGVNRVGLSSGVQRPPESSHNPWRAPSIALDTRRLRKTRLVHRQWST
jgi:hypothetical protein